MGNDSMKLITASDIVEISLSEDLLKNNFNNMERFQKIYNDLVNESDFLEFNMILSEFKSENKSLACFSARVAQVSANSALAIVVGATVVSGGTASPITGPALVALISAVAGADMAVQTHCRQF